MADLDEIKAEKDYHLDKPFTTVGDFHVKGAGNLDWGMRKRLSNIFNPKTGNTVMFAFDHGYFMGSVSGLERLDLLIPRLAPHIDVLMGTRGALRTSVSPSFRKGVALRVSSGSSMLNDDLSHETLAVDIEDAIRMDADCMAVQVFIGADGQKDSIDTLSKVVNAGNRYGVPTLGVVAVGKDMERTDRYFKLATRIIAELGANIVKTYYCDRFEEVVAACPVPIVVAGGKKLPEKEALDMAFKAMQGGASGLDMGRNIFQSRYPQAMADAVSKIVHENFTINEAWEFFEDTRSCL
ncbi:MAG: 3-hydroxy-5-phosphonooxypentane-2,4-dione thiolase [Treponema sp.]|jgi:putative autoinducer-2 (AI-2) aldolase|nr:3-hydroxy-5-phosphonooxypentane-2,4-dione thiolase [Treponema sp.]